MKLNIQLFASGTITFTADGHLQGKIEWSSTSNGSSLNSSNVTATLYAKVTSGTTTGKSWKGYVKIGDASGHNFNGFSSSKSISSSWVKIAEYTDTISHNNDGTKSITISGWVKGPTDTTLENRKSSGSASVQLETIPRASQIAGVTSSTTPYYPTIGWIPASSTFKYRVKYSYGNYSTTSSLISPNQTTAYDYNGLQITNSIFTGVSSSSLSATATLYTYASDGTTQIGDADTAQFTVTLNSAIKPNVSISNLAEADATMISKNWGIYVQGKSKLSFKVSTSGSSLPAPNVTTTASTNSQTFSFNGYADKTFTTNVLNTTGTNTITASATDSRNRTTTATAKTYSVVAYSAPTINTAQVQRCDANGNVDKNGQYCLISYNASISSCDNHNKAGAEYKVGYREQNTGSYQYVSLGTNANSKSASGILFTDGIKSASSSGTKVQFSDSTYDIQFYVKDSFTTVTNIQPLDAGFDLLNFNASGKAMAIGKVSEAGSNEELLEIALPTKFTEYVKDELVVESIRSKNMLGLIDGTYTSNGITAVVSNGQITLSGTPSSGTSFLQVPLINNMEIKTNIDYTLGANNDFILGDNLNTQWAGIRVVYTNSTTSSSMSFYRKNNYRVINNNSSLIVRALEIRTASGLTYNNNIIKPQLETSSSATTYYPYQNLDYKGEIYSTSETKIGNWIDAKPLYRKVFNIGNLPNTSTKTISTGLSNILPVNIYGYAYNSSTKVMFVFNNGNPVGLNFQIQAYYSNGDILIQTGSDRSSYSGYTILEYTKTTD